ncbi:MAG: polysaccharide biosynthesis protein [Nitrospirae bacterium]|nr:MAG: polysaccharide biosynthesis protein [Nitrospirota bacterium]
MLMKSCGVNLLKKFWDVYGQTLIRHRKVLVITAQLALVGLANLTAFLLRFDGTIPSAYRDKMLYGLPIVLLVYSTCLRKFGVQQGLWRYVGLYDCRRIFAASIVAAMISYIVLHVLLQWKDYPRSIIILTGLLSGLYLVAIRIGIRWLRECARRDSTAQRALIVGAGNAGEQLVRDMLQDPQSPYNPVAFVDDDPVKQRTKIHGVPVIGTIADIKAGVERCQAQEIIVAIPTASTSVKQRILEASEGCAVPIKILPSMKQLLSDPALLRQLKPMSLEDLLQREPIETDLQSVRALLADKNVLVTGAGGSIGSELCRQVARCCPASLILFERYENGLYAIDLELRRTFPDLTILPLVGDVTVAEQVSELFRVTSPDIIFHAAAHKHVPLMEGNPIEAVRNNVFGTRTVADAAYRSGASRFVLISTDKAVNPCSVMGATKRIAELLIQQMNNLGDTKFAVVRFGNVLGSNGSVVPLFAEQIRRGGPVTVTHPDIKRYFMTIPEAVQLVLQASVLVKGGDIFVLDMGEQIRVSELARNMITLSGLVPDKDIQITYTGLRPGEKLYEELFDQSECVEATSHPKIKRAVRCEGLPDELDRMLQHLEATLYTGNVDKVLCILKNLVPNYIRGSSENSGVQAIKA